MFDSIKRRLREILDASGEIKRRAAPRVQARLRQDATTRRGNVPSFGKMGNVPIVAEVRPEGIYVNGPEWVMEKAQEKGQPADWAEIVIEETRDVLGGK